MNMIVCEDMFAAFKSFGSFGSWTWVAAQLDGAFHAGMKLVIELIPNHTSRRHKWFLQSRQSVNNPYGEFYVWDNGRRFENGTRYPPNNWVVECKHFFVVYLDVCGSGLSDAKYHLASQSKTVLYVQSVNINIVLW